MKTCIYLRKSRADEELEKKENVDTLARHRSTLLEVAKKQDLNIVEIKEEVVSGDSIAKRPKMIQLLEEVENNTYDAVLCMDIDRLGRGDMQDQGKIINTFKESNTLIVTPDKIYNLNNDLDEEMTEFKTFFARRELKVITKRMQRGRVKSIEEGNFIGSVAPLGYKFKYDEYGKRHMIIDEETAPAIKLIFDMYLNGEGAYKIMNHLNALGYKTTAGKCFTECAVRRIIRNRTYCGYVTWFEYKRKGTKTRKNKGNDMIVCKGKHKPIISEDDWEKAQEIRINNQIPAKKSDRKLINPLAGIVKCSNCKHTMVASYYTGKEGPVLYLRCKQCYEVGSSRLDLIEEEIINILKIKLKEIKDELDNTEIEDRENKQLEMLQNTLTTLDKEKTELDKQKNKLHDLLERGIYDVDTFLERQQTLANKKEEIEIAIKGTKKLLEVEVSKDIDYKELAENIECAIESYENTDNIELKNKALKTIIKEILYNKEKKRFAQFTLEVKFRI